MHNSACGAEGMPIARFGHGGSDAECERGAGVIVSLRHAASSHSVHPCCFQVTELSVTGVINAESARRAHTLFSFSLRLEEDKHTARYCTETDETGDGA